MLFRIRAILTQKRGFSLVEVIFSIGILALLSGTAIQAFVVSSNLNAKAAALDIATAAAVSQIETFKEDPQSFFAGDEVINNSTFHYDETGSLNEATGVGSYAPPLKGFIMETLQSHNKQGLYQITVKMYDIRFPDTEILELNAARYVYPLTTNEEGSL